MVSFWFLISYTVSVFYLGVLIASSHLMPEEYPWDWLEFLGVVCFLAAIICWEVTRK